MTEDLAANVVAASRAAAERRLHRLRERAFLIGQAGVAAALTWLLARHVLGHPMPFFAPVTALICLGLSYGQRIRRVVELMIGVALGVLTGDVFVHLLGTGPWQITVAVVVAMSLAALVGQGPLIATQAGVQAVIVTTLVASPGSAFSRWLDAVAGGVVALVLALVAPATPVRRPRRQAAQIVREISAVLRDAASGLAAHDSDATQAALDRARRTEEALSTLQEAAAEGMAVVRLSPIRRHHADDVRAVLELVTPLDHCLRNLRVLVRRAHVATWRDERVPTAYVRLLQSLAEATDDVAGELAQRRLPEGARRGLYRVGELSAVLDSSAGLSGEVMRAQVRSMVVDLLRLTGLSQDDAADAVPETFDA